MRLEDNSFLLFGAVLWPFSEANSSTAGGEKVGPDAPRCWVSLTWFGQIEGAPSSRNWESLETFYGASLGIKLRSLDLLWSLVCYLSLCRVTLKMLITTTIISPAPGVEEFQPDKSHPAATGGVTWRKSQGGNHTLCGLNWWNPLQQKTTEENIPLKSFKVCKFSTLESVLGVFFFFRMLLITPDLSCITSMIWRCLYLPPVFFLMAVHWFLRIAAFSWCFFEASMLQPAGFFDPFWLGNPSGISPRNLSPKNSPENKKLNQSYF